jgi:hypothetical protein
MKHRYIIIGCGAAKRDVRSAAVELYTGTLYRKRLAYARTVGGPHFILSALHGVIVPTFEIDPYNETLPERPTDRSRAWSDDVARFFIGPRAGGQGRPFSGLLSAGDELVVLASSRYIDGWAPRVREAGILVTEPMRGLTMPGCMKWLTEQEAAQQ